MFFTLRVSNCLRHNYFCKPSVPITAVWYSFTTVFLQWKCFVFFLTENCPYRRRNVTIRYLFTLKTRVTVKALLVSTYSQWTMCQEIHHVFQSQTPEEVEFHTGIYMLQWCFRAELLLPQTVDYSQPPLHQQQQQQRLAAAPQALNVWITW